MLSHWEPPFSEGSLPLMSRILRHILLARCSESENRQHVGFTVDHGFTELTSILAIPSNSETDIQKPQPSLRSSNETQNDRISPLFGNSLAKKREMRGVRD